MQVGRASGLEEQRQDRCGRPEGRKFNGPSGGGFGAGVLLGLRSVDCCVT